MKKQLLIALSLVVVALTMNSCFGFGGGNEEVSFKQSDLYSNGGLWLEDGTQHYVRFTTEQTDTTGYLYGREWNEADDVHETDLKKYGSGWFKYQLVQKNLTEIHLMDNGGAEIPKVYVVTVLTDEKLEYYNKEVPSKKYYFSKQAEAK